MNKQEARSVGGGVFDELRKRYEREYEAYMNREYGDHMDREYEDLMNRKYEAYMDREYEAYRSMQEDEYHFGRCVEEIRRFAREEVLTEIGKEASEHLLKVALGVEDLSGWSLLKEKGEAK